MFVCILYMHEGGREEGKERNGERGRVGKSGRGVGERGREIKRNGKRKVLK